MKKTQHAKKTVTIIMVILSLLGVAAVGAVVLSAKPDGSSPALVSTP